MSRINTNGVAHKAAHSALKCNFCDKGEYPDNCPCYAFRIAEQSARNAIKAYRNLILARIESILGTSGVAESTNDTMDKIKRDI